MLISSVGGVPLPFTNHCSVALYRLAVIYDKYSINYCSYHITSTEERHNNTKSNK